MAVTTAERTAPVATKRKKNAFSDGQGALAAMLLAPTMLVLLLVAGIPIIMSVTESFFRTNDRIDPQTGLVQTGTNFVGFQNFTDIFAHPATVVGVYGSMDRLVNSFINTTLFTVVCVILETVLGVSMALIMAKAFRGRGLVRASILVPWAIPTIVSAMMWKLIFNTSGVANKVLGLTNNPILWLADNKYSQISIIVADVWKTAPFIGLLTLAGLQTIPAEVYEAARVDGANAWQTFVRITLPMVKPALVVAVLFRTLDTLRMFDLPYGMIGANKYSVETLSMFAYQETMQTRYGPAAAYSIILFFYIVLVAFLFVKLLGADVVGDEELKAVNAQRKRMKALHQQQAKAAGRVRTNVTSGSAAS
ncbi:MAG: carbohydrate ABC transporter permease [Propionibacteriaceae bacterium]